MPTTPDLADVITDGVEGRMIDVMTSTIGIVQKYDPATDTVDVNLPIMHPVNEDGDVAYQQLPVLPSLPIAWPQGGGFVLTFPLKKGDAVLVIFTHDDPGLWRETGAPQTIPTQLQRHSLAHGFVIPGVRPATTPLAPGQAINRVAGIVLGKDGGDQVIEITDAGIGLGHLAVAPVALAPGVVTALNALSTWTKALQTALALGLGPTNAGVLIAAGLLPATTALTAALTAASVPGTGVPATLVKGK